MPTSASLHLIGSHHRGGGALLWCACVQQRMAELEPERKVGERLGSARVESEGKGRGSGSDSCVSAEGSHRRGDCHRKPLRGRG